MDGRVRNGYVLDERTYSKIGKFFISVHNNGSIHDKDSIIMIERGCPDVIIKKKIRILLKASDNKEMKDISQYMHIKSVTGSHGISICLIDDGDNQSYVPSTIYGVIPCDISKNQEDAYTLELTKLLKEKIKTITYSDTMLTSDYKPVELGIMLCAQSTNMIYALIKSCLTEKINIYADNIGHITKEMVIRSSTVYTKNAKMIILKNIINDMELYYSLIQCGDTVMKKI